MNVTPDFMNYVYIRSLRERAAKACETTKREDLVLRFRALDENVTVEEMEELVAEFDKD